MDYTDAEIQELRGPLSQKWELAAASDVEKLDFEHLREVLAARIKEMLTDDFEGLVNAMYRLDVPEPRFREAMSGADPNGIALQIADLVLHREILRIRTRRAWQARKNQDEPS